MIDKPLESIGRADLETLVTSKRHEGRTLDYKRDLPGTNDEQRREFARDVSSFANAAGGDIIFGAEEAKDDAGRGLGYPEKLVGVDASNFDATKLRLDGIIRDNIDPRVQGIAYQKVDGFERGPVIVLRILKSWLAPHMMSFQNKTHFFSRNSAGKQPLDVREIRAAFAASADAAERAKRFRDERIARIIAGETPLMMRKDHGERRLVLHTIPLGIDIAFDVRALARNPGDMPPPAPTGWDHRFNLEGFVTYCGSGNEQRTYCQAFRNGNFESLVLPHADAHANPPELFAQPFELTVVDGFDVHLRLLRKHGVEVPVVMSVTLIGLAGFRVYAGRDLYQQGPYTLRENVVMLPDVVVEGEPALQPLLRPTFDALWQASGYDRSLGYDEKGNWLEHAR